MFTLHLNTGLASNYFVTDTKKFVGVSENPYLVFSNTALNDKALAEILVTIHNAIYSTGFFKQRKKQDPEQVALLFDDLRNQRKSSISIQDIANPVLILSNGFEKTTLTAIKILVTRAICQILAVDISSSGGDEILNQSELISQKIEETAFYKIYKPYKKLCVVSGTRDTVLSTEINASQILQKFPDLCSKIDLDSVNEPLFE